MLDGDDRFAAAFAFCPKIGLNMLKTAVVIEKLSKSNQNINLIFRSFRQR